MPMPVPMPMHLHMRMPMPMRIYTRGRSSNLTVAHVGDSRGVLCREGGALAITQVT